MTAIAIILALVVGLGVLVVFVLNEVPWMTDYFSAIFTLPMELLSGLPSDFLFVPYAMIALLGVGIVVYLFRDIF